MPILDKKLALVAAFAASSASRPALQHVRLVRKGAAVEAAATDSYIAARIVRADMPKADQFPILPNGKTAVDLDGELLVPSSVVSDIGKALPKKSNLEVLKTAALFRLPDAPHAEIVATDLTEVSSRVFGICEEKYPNLDEIIDAPIKGFKVRVNAGYLAKIAKMFHEFNADGNGLDAVELELTGDDRDLIRFTAETSGHKAEALLMKIGA